jgi:hypothetical protein
MKQAAAQLRDARFQISRMEQLLEGAVEHGATLIRDRLQAILPVQQMLISENAHARGFRIEGYGVFFDVEVPSLFPTFLSTVRSLDQNDLGLESALREVKKYIDANGDTNLQQALKRIELQMTSSLPPVVQAVPAVSGARSQTGSPAAAADDRPPADPILNDPNEAYRAEVRNQIITTMLDYAQSIPIGPDEWLTIGARRRDERPLFAPADSDAGTMVIRVRGTDLTSLRSGSLSRADALNRVEVRVF